MDHAMLSRLNSGMSLTGTDSGISLTVNIVTNAVILEFFSLLLDPF